MSLEVTNKPNLELAYEWWAEHGWTPMPVNSLPPTAALASWDGKPVCMGWLYLTDSDFAIMEWIISDPKEKRKDVRAQCLDAIVLELLERARAAGRPLITTNIKHPKLLERLKKLGFNTADTELTSMMAKLW